ncbi:tetratricopeptide repeat protein [Streptomyces sp. NPDC051909]|uniref:tetratricopeptide repeat protein n=1 Tax=Streptomyces sp. NPDC051909 TaxID=3154944 RepID=UPI00343EA9EE
MRGRKGGDVEAGGARSVAAGGNIERVTTGDHVTQVEHATLLPPEALNVASAPHLLVNVPRRSAHFVGRREELERLDEGFAAGAGTGAGAGAGVLVICGLGGVGKSTLAARWAESRAEGRTGEGAQPPALVWWITAESRADLDAGLAGLGAALQPALIDVLPPEALRERALQWLSAHDDWLLVLDNVSAPEDIGSLLGRVRRGRILVTTRQTGGWHGIARVLTLDVPAAHEAVEMFTRILTHTGPRDTAGVHRLCAALGQLPLAIDQAAAFCGQTGTSPVEYLEQLSSYAGEVYALRIGGGGNEVAVAWTWRLTLDRLAEADPLTGTILRVLAWWAPDRIPRALLDRIAAPFAVRSALGLLARHSMLTVHDDGTVSVHRLVQAVARTPDADDPHRRAADIDTARRAAEEALLAVLPTDLDDPAGWRAWRLLFLHVDAYVQQADANVDTARTAELVVRAAWRLLDTGDWDLAEVWFERAARARQRVLGADDPLTVLAREGIAECWARTGDPGPAAYSQEQVVEDLTRLLGEERAETHLARARLGVTRRHLGDTGGAVRLLEGALSGLERLLGAAHRDTLRVRNNLGVAYQVAGRLEEAIGVHEGTLAERARLLGPGHSDTLTSRLNLVHLYAAVGRTEQAAAGYDAVLADSLRLLGEDHPFTVHVRHTSRPGSGSGM